MDLAISNPAVIAQNAPLPLGRFPVDSAENHSAPDWRPGETLDKNRPAKLLTAFLVAQRENLLELRTALVSSMYGIAHEMRHEAADKSALSSHPGDAGSDAYDRDFAFILLSEGSNSLLEIDKALARIDQGTYGVCEMSGDSIPLARLRTVPFARFTVKCQMELEKRTKLPSPPRPFASPFAVADDKEVDEG